MIQELFTPSVQHWLDLVGIFVFAISGALMAVRKNWDVFGIAVLAGIAAIVLLGVYLPMFGLTLIATLAIERLALRRLPGPRRWLALRSP